MFQTCKFQHVQEQRTWCYSGICKRTLVRAASMDPLAVVEAQLGSVESWPSYVLRFMFMLEPNSCNEEGSSVYIREQRKTE